MRRAVESIARTIGERPRAGIAAMRPSIKRAGSGRRRRRVSVRLRRVQRRPAVLGEGRRQRSFGDSVLARCKRHEVLRRAGLFGTVRLFRIHARYVRRAVSRRQDAAEDDVGGAAYAPGRAPRTRGGARAFPRLRSGARRRLDLPAHRHRASLDRDSSAAMNEQSVVARLADARRDRPLRRRHRSRACYAAGARALAIDLPRWARTAGYELAQDALEMCSRGEREPARTPPPLLVGSHLDTVPNGRRVRRRVRRPARCARWNCSTRALSATAHPVEAVAWAGEEGSRFPLGVWVPSLRMCGARMRCWL